MPWRQRTAGRTGTLMAELGWSAVRVRDLTRGGYKDQVRFVKTERDGHYQHTLGKGFEMASYFKMLSASGSLVAIPLDQLFSGRLKKYGVECKKNQDFFWISGNDGDLERDEFTFGHILRLRSSLRTRRM
jgi:hypothetical protein